MNALMKEACALLDGRGGGKPDLAQGGGKNVDRLEEAIESARSALLVGTSHPHRDFQKHS
jgi:alanyl-tRNA synthetase